jgi:ADP-heptose:LPS heptosyltransferase
MSITTRLKNPETAQDWLLMQHVPDYARRLAISTLRGLLGQITYAPIWSGQPAHLRDLDNLDRTINCPLAEQIAPVFEKALPATFKHLGWADKLPEDLVSYRDILSLVSLGFKELFATQSDNRIKQPWPAGIDKEHWLNKIRTRGREFRPLVELISYWEKELQPWAPTLLIHGSCATLDHVPGASDLDTLMIVGRDTLCNPDALAAFTLKFLQSQQYLFRFNPYMHHGHMLVTELELGELSEACLPLCLIENGVTFGARWELALNSDPDLETLFAIKAFEEFFERTITGTDDIKTGFDLLWWESSAIFIPLLYMQMKDRKSRWKPTALEAAQQHLEPEELGLIDYLTQLRLRMGGLFPPLLPSISDSLAAGANPGLIIKLQKEATLLSPPQLAGLGIDDRRIMQARAMYQRLASEATRLFFDRYADDSLLKACITAFAGKTIIERPTAIDGSMYDATRDWIITLAQKAADIKAVYQYGEVGCPGLSDLDMLVVMKDDATRPTPFQLQDLPPLFRDVMGHDATFISSDSLSLFPRVFPLFGAQRVCGDGKEDIATTFSDWKSVLPIYTIILLAKYPTDLIYLSQQGTIRFKTILAFLHSFKHFIPLFDLLGSEIPSAVIDAVKKDAFIRQEFSEGKTPLASELPEIMELMFRATAAVARSLDDAWAGICPSLPTMTAPMRFDYLGIEFKENWSEEELLGHCVERLSKSYSAFIPFPSNLGWFIYWLSLGTGMVSKTIADNLNRNVPNLTAPESEAISAFDTLAPFCDDLNAFADNECRRGRSVSKYSALVDITPETFAGGPNQGISVKSKENTLTGERKTLSLASVPELSSVEFRDFMTTMNCFAERWNLRQFTNWSKVWEYPWLWFNVLSTVDWQNKRVLDLGSEISPMPWFLASLGANVTLIECDPQWVPIWEGLIVQTGFNVDWRVVDSETLPFTDNSFDVVTSFSVIEHQPDKRRAVDEVARVLKPGGLFALSFDICEPDMGMTFPEWNGRALTMPEFEDTVWRHPAFSVKQAPPWNTEDLTEFVQWHLQSAPHHNYAVGAAVLRKKMLDKNKAKRILIPRFDTFGDIVLLEGFLDALMQRYPDAEITLLVREGYNQLAHLFPGKLQWVTTTINPFKELGQQNLEEVKACIDKIAGYRPDLLLITTYWCSWLDCAIAAVIWGANKIAVGDQDRINDQLTIVSGLLDIDTRNVFTKIIEVPARIHETEKYQALWDYLSRDGGTLPLPKLHVPHAFTLQAQDILDRMGLGTGKFFVCLPGGTQSGVTLKTWSAERFAEIIAWVKNEYALQPLLVGHECESEFLVRVTDALKGAGITPFVWIGKDGEMPLLAALMERAGLYIGNDTGPMHIAAALDIPVVGVFGGGHWQCFLPVGEHSLGIVGTMPCFGCRWNCIFDNALCVPLVGIEDVKKAITLVFGEEKTESNFLPATETISDELAYAIGLAKTKFDIIESDRAARLETIFRHHKWIRESDERERQLNQHLQESQKRLYICEADLAVQTEKLAVQTESLAVHVENMNNLCRQLQDSEQRLCEYESIAEKIDELKNTWSNPEELIKALVVICLKKLRIYDIYVRHEPLFSRCYHLVRNLFARTNDASPYGQAPSAEVAPPIAQVEAVHPGEDTPPILELSALPEEPPHAVQLKQVITPLMEAINSPMIEALVEGRALAGDLDEEALIYFYEFGQSMRHVLCLSPSPQNIQILYMLSKGGCAVTCLAGSGREEELQTYGFRIITEGIGQWLKDKDSPTFADFGGILLDGSVDTDIMHLLKGRLCRSLKILFNGNNPSVNPLKDAGLVPRRTESGIDIYDAPPESWLDLLHGIEASGVWPWTAPVLVMPATMPSGRPWPKISIVTVTLNQGPYLEETIRSVLMQGYPNLEYIVIDGGSSDNTATILDRYRNQLACCISEKDRGQSDALNKGFRLSTGEVLAWLNSDDCYLPATLWRVALAFDTYDAEMVAGGCALRQGDEPEHFRIHHNTLPVGSVVPLPLDRLLDIDGSWQTGDFFYQPEVFWTRSLWERSGAHVDENLFYSMDYELWVRMASNNAGIIHLPDTLTLFRIHEKQKTSGEDLPFLPELRKINAELKEKLKR